MTVESWKLNQGPPLRIRPQTIAMHVGGHSRARDAGHYGCGQVTTVEGVTSMEAASQTVARDVTVTVGKVVEAGRRWGPSPQMKPWDERTPVPLVHFTLYVITEISQNTSFYLCGVSRKR